MSPLTATLTPIIDGTFGFFPGQAPGVSPGGGVNLNVATLTPIV